KIPSDIDIFLLRDKERERAKAERERKKTLKVHEKMTYSTMMNAKQSGFKKELQKEEEAEDKELAAEAQRLKALQESISWKIAVTKGKEPARLNIPSGSSRDLMGTNLTNKDRKPQRFRALLFKAIHYLVLPTSEIILIQPCDSIQVPEAS
uniref:Uncharacterized protein n=1 Tax=Gopherus evgoodei TaxID=1825980 RepID=A0A8C4VX56_9SAUR